MAIIIGEVVANITGDPAKFEQAMDGVKRSGETAITGIENRFKKLTSDIGMQGRMLSKTLTAPIIAIGGALFGATVKASNFADEIDKMSIRSGVSRQRLQELRFVTDQVGVEFGAVEQAADGLRRRLLQIEEGSGRSAEVFGRLGVSIRGADGQMRSMDELMPDVIASLAQIENETERSALAMEVFGRSASGLAPLLAQGEAGIEALTARAHELGLVMGDEAIADMVEFKDQMAEVQQQAGAVAREFGMVLMPIIKNDLIPIIRDQLVPAIRNASKFFTDLDDGTKKTAITIAAIAASAGPVMMAVGAFGKLAVAIKAVTVAMLANPYMAAGIALLAFTGYAIRARRASNQLTEAFYAQLDAQLKVNGTVEDGIRLGRLLSDAIDTRAVRTNSAEQNRLLDERIDLLRELIQLNAEMMQQGRAEVESTGRALQEMGRNVRPISELILPEDEMADIKFRSEQAVGYIDDILNGVELNIPDKLFPPGSLGFLLDQIKAINQALLATTDPEQISAYIQRVNDLTQAMRELRGETEEQNDELSAFELMAVRATESFTKGLADAVVYGNNLKDTLNDIIKQLASRALQQFLMIALTGGTGGAAAGLGGILGRVFGVGDALIRSNGDVVQFHPNDNLMAWQGANMPNTAGKSLSLTIPIQVDGRTVWEANRNFEIDL